MTLALTVHDGHGPLGCLHHRGRRTFERGNYLASRREQLALGRHASMWGPSRKVATYEIQTLFVAWVDDETRLATQIA